MADTMSDDTQAIDPPGPDARGTRHLAGVGRRAVAIFLDTLILYIVTVVIAHWLGYGAGYAPLGFTLPAPGWVIWGICIYAYFVLTEWIFERTIGKAATGLRVRTDTGERVGIIESLLRNLLRIADALPYLIVPYLVGAISIWNTRHNKRLGDLLANTVVETSRTRVPGGVAAESDRT